MLQCASPIELGSSHESFIPLPASRVASDKRLVAHAFREADVPMPRTFLVEEFSDVIRHVTEHPGTEWCLKFPTGCGASGHRLVTPGGREPSCWPRPWVLQEFVRLQRPEVYRTYSAGGSLFGWVARCFPEKVAGSPWVSHAHGARYAFPARAPSEALEVARAALDATGLWETFGCVDLIRRPSGEWLALEVGTDGIFNHVDRELDNEEFEMELSARVVAAFWQRARSACSSI